MRVSLNPVRRNIPGAVAARAEALLESAGARVILGLLDTAMGMVEPIAPRADTLFGPRGAALASPTGPLFVCDTGHHRLLVWTGAPTSDGEPADLLIGQPDFASEGRNAKGPIGPATLNVPTGLAASDGVLAVADAWNHRVLLWRKYPTAANQPADIVLGQADFTGGLANRGTGRAAADTLNWCYGVSIAEGALFVADTGNRRVLKWNRIPTENGAPADLVLGQADFVTRDENAGRNPDAVGMRWPHGMVFGGGHLFVADAGNNRVMAWDGMPVRNGEPCALVLGQADAFSVDHNQGAYHPTASALNMPYGLAVLGDRLVVADTANSRLVAHDLDAVDTGAPACRLAAQPMFQDKGDNRWGNARRDSLCWPYGLSCAGNTLAIADSGNNRVMLWEAAP